MKKCKCGKTFIPKKGLIKFMAKGSYFFARMKDFCSIACATQALKNIEEEPSVILPVAPVKPSRIPSVHKIVRPKRKATIYI